VATDPLLVAGSDRMVWAVFADSSGGVWLQGYREGRRGGWLDWCCMVITAIPVGVAVTAGDLWIAALDHHNDLWRYSAADHVRTFGSHIVQAA
jgi:hypothetical protein